MDAGAKVAIAERWSVLRRGLTDVVSARHRVVADVADVAELAALVRTEAVDLVLVGDDAGIDLATVVSVFASAAIGVPVAVLCDDISADRLRELLRNGAVGVLSKKVDDEALLDAIARVLRAERVIDQRFLPLLFGDDELRPVDRGSGHPLTRREREVLEHLARGASTREIAAALLLGESTVKTHLGRIYSKLGVSGRHRAVGRALELGLLG